MAFRARPQGQALLNYSDHFTCFPEWNKNISTNIKEDNPSIFSTVQIIFLDSSQILTALEDFSAVTL